VTLPDVTVMQMNVQPGRRRWIFRRMSFWSGSCQLITGETLAPKMQLSAGNNDFAGVGWVIAAKR
jgi:hypothetical protein